MSDIDNNERQPVEFRAASVAAVDFEKRLITVVAAPYDETAIVRYRSELMEESFDRGAFDSLKSTRPGRVKANLEHDRTSMVGKVMRWDPDSNEGNVAEVRISRTPRGDETLALADDDVLGASLEFAPRRQHIERRSGGYPRRRIQDAFVDWLAFTGEPAYTGAKVLSVRSAEEVVNAADLPPLHTPLLDEWTAYLASRRAGVAS